MWLGVYAPERVKGLILANTGAQIGPIERWDQLIGTVEAKGMGAMVGGLMERWFTPGFRARRPDVIANFRAMIESCSPTGYAGCSAAVRDADLRDAIGRIQVPSLIIVGTQDPATPPALGELLRDRIPGARLAALDAAHLSSVEQPDGFASAVLDLIASEAPSYG